MRSVITLSMPNKKIAILGTHGIPARYGGFETFAQELATRLQAREYQVIVYCEPSENPIVEYGGVELRYTRYMKSEHPLLFYFDCIWQASRSSDLLLVTGTGGALFNWIPKLSKKVLITNIDGVESRRGKWGLLKKTFIKLTEYVAVMSSDTVVADSVAIKSYVLNKYRVPSDRVVVIEYGAVQNIGAKNPTAITKYGLLPNEYYLVVARLEPENNVLEIIEGYLATVSTKLLIIVGGLKDTTYVSRIKDIASRSSGRVRLIGAIYDQAELDALRFFCYAYLHGHSVGGTNPSLLEALAAGNIAICHDNEFNREVTENRMFYFKSSPDLTMLINEIEMLQSAALEGKKTYALNRVASHYNWERIADEYRKLFASYLPCKLKSSTIACKNNNCSNE